MYDSRHSASVYCQSKKQKTKQKKFPLKVECIFVIHEKTSRKCSNYVIGGRAGHYQGCTNSSWCGIYIYVWRYVCHNSSACHAYVMWAELGHCQFLYVPAVLNVVTTGNGTGTKNVLKWNRGLGFEFSIQSSVYGATTVA